ncbi:MAG: SpoIIE family protein phosphatase [Bacteroidia bacterium]|nr:SpoIIE family protein phosphatase [Bacteroidia bacterium]
MGAVILCVDDERSVLDTLSQQIVSALGKEFEIEVAQSGEEALELAQQLEKEGLQLAVVLTDQIMPGMKGDELLIQLHRTHPEALKILLTGQANLEAIQNAINNANLYRYLSKPWQADDLILTVTEAARSFLYKKQLQKFDESNRLLRELNKATQDISSEIHFGVLVNRFLQYASQSTGVERIFLLTQQTQQGTTRFKIQGFICSILYDQQQLRERFHNDREALTQEIQQRLIVYLSVAEANSHTIALPLRKGNYTYGYILAENPHSLKPIGSLQREILTILASQTAISMEIANLYANLEHQKKIIEQKNKDVTESLTYARRIQYALLPSGELLRRYFPQSFIFYKPKDIVSGDFYWYCERNNHMYIATVDCTGHGVPGAFMSVLGASQLTEIIQHHAVEEPNLILSKLHEKISENLNKGSASENSEEGLNDGMELALCRINLSSKQIHFAGANRPIWLERNGQIIIFPGDKQPVGQYERLGKQETRSFQTQTIDTKPGDVLYLFSDGIVDQFGGKEGRRLSKKKFLEFLTQIVYVPVTQRGELIEEFITQWQGNNEQTDDMMVIGIGF